MSSSVASELIDAHITSKGEALLGNPDNESVNGVLYLSHAGKPFNKTLKLSQNGSKLTFLVKIPQLEILDPCGVTDKLLNGSSCKSEGFHKILKHLGDSEGVEFLTRFFEQVHNWNETPCEQLGNSIWVVNEYSWHFADGAIVKIAIKVEPLVSRDSVNRVKYVLLQISGFQRKSVEPERNGNIDDQSFASNIEEILTKREMEVLDLIIKGYTSKAMATELYISEHTVKNHRKNILRKTGVSSTMELAMKTLRRRD